MFLKKYVNIVSIYMAPTLRLAREALFIALHHSDGQLQLCFLLCRKRQNDFVFRNLCRFFSTLDIVWVGDVCCKRCIDVQGVPERVVQMCLCHTSPARLKRASRHHTLLLLALLSPRLESELIQSSSAALQKSVACERVNFLSLQSRAFGFLSFVPHTIWSRISESLGLPNLHVSAFI